ncbi:hypothetical protein RFI_06452 [Reticulomyxa filosa]|uniref:Transmembrane protein n=1 Tax=Reticulomyxa filosa TaxID=46433 RepID=X6NWI0_RETFI|nr:hypothetical protein RFI_06452 [Reticulomyxa filosa]|eukprot:ETO30670.1 hypothetical protein RFI_06452 [Reticulomyxa filosa]
MILYQLIMKYFIITLNDETNKQNYQMLLFCLNVMKIITLFNFINYVFAQLFNSRKNGLHLKIYCLFHWAIVLGYWMKITVIYRQVDSKRKRILLKLKTESSSSFLARNDLTKIECCNSTYKEQINHYICLICKQHSLVQHEVISLFSKIFNNINT